jgi:hypothetical protein
LSITHCHHHGCDCDPWCCDVTTGSAAGVESLDQILSALESAAASQERQHPSNAISAAVAAAAAASSKRTTVASTSSSSSNEGEGGLAYAFKKLINVRDDSGVTALHLAVERYVDTCSLVVLSVGRSVLSSLAVAPNITTSCWRLPLVVLMQRFAS